MTIKFPFLFLLSQFLFSAFAGILDTPPAPPLFRITASSGLNANISAGILVFYDGSCANISAGSLSLQPSTTNYVMVDLRDCSLHAWKRNHDRASVFLGSVITASNSITTIKQPAAFIAPPSRIPKTRAKLAAGQPLRVLCLGDSTTQGAGAAGGSNWVALLTSSAFASQPVSLGKTNITTVNMGLGGQVAKWGMACLANSIVSPGRVHTDFPYWGCAQNTCINGEHAGSSNWVCDAPLLQSKPDLAIISFGANSSASSTEELAYLESAIARLRRRGIEVILWNGYYRNQFSSIQNSQFDKYRTIADYQGCEFVDTFSRIEELNRDASGAFTAATYTDNDIHQNNAGHLATAGAFKALFSAPQAPESPSVPQDRLLLNAQYTWFPNSADIEFFAPSGTSVTTKGPAVTTAALGPNLVGLTASNASYAVGAGSNLQWSFSRALAVDCFFSSSTTVTLTNWINGGGWGRGLSVPNQSWGGLLGILSLSDMQSVNLGYGLVYQTNWIVYPNWGFRMMPTDNAINIESAIAYTFDGYTVPWSAMQFSGLWATEASVCDSGRQWHYSDDVGNAILTLPFTGNGLMLYLHSFTASGKINASIDGTPIFSAFDLYWSPGGGYAFQRTLPLFCNTATGKLSDNYGPHIARIELLSSLNGSATNSANQNRRLALYEAYAVDAR